MQIYRIKDEDMARHIGLDMSQTSELPYVEVVGNVFEVHYCDT